jgi:hypothetical protein
MWIKTASLFLLAALLLTPSLAQTPANCTPVELFGNPDWTRTDFCQTTVNLAEVRSGGPRKDGIPAITNPQMETVEQASAWLNPQSPVIVVEVEGEARAYPQAILMWHEIANDEVGGVPLSITFCPLCNSSIVFDRRVGEAVLEFGVSGLLRKSDMVMYDRQTDSWWQQFTGEGIVGQYAGQSLTLVPSQVVGFGQFVARYPEGLVMSRETGYSRSYGMNPYRNYDEGDPFLFSGNLDRRLPTMERVLAVRVKGQPVAYPFSVLSEQKVINDEVEGRALLALWQPGVATALGAGTIDEGRDIGTAALYERTLADGQTLSFVMAEGVLRDEQTGSTWNLWGEATEGPLAGQRLFRTLAAPHFWFAWAAFYPETAVYAP